MPRLLKLLAVVASLALIALALRPQPAVGEGGEGEDAKLPVDFKNYFETVTGKEADDKATFEMIAVPGGSFVMGSPANEPGRNADEGPQHPVTIRPFWLGKCEVTWDEFTLFQDEVGVENPEENEERLKKDADALTGPTPPYVEKHYGHPHAKHPALCMTHNCAMWYKANSVTEKKLNGGTHAVGTKKPNAFGLYDMYGNVMEWCLDYYYKDGYAKFPLDKPALSPVFVPMDKRWSHVARGGSWADAPAGCRSAARRASDVSWMQDDPNRPRSIWWLTKFDVIGFRVARALIEQAELKGLRSKVTRESD